MSIFSVGVIGLGRSGLLYHVPQISNHAKFILNCVYDVLPSRVAEVSEKFNVTGYCDLEEFISSPIDMAVIATPTHLHHSIAIALLNAGKHVIIEKPMAMNAQEANQIVNAAKVNNKIVTVCQPERMTAHFQQIVKIVKENTIGKIYHVKRGVYNYVTRNDWQCLKKFGGGMLNNYGSHGLDLLLQLTGYDIKASQIYCQKQNILASGDTEDIVKVIYTTKSGVWGELDINQASALNGYDLEILGHQGAIKYYDNQIEIKTLENLIPKASVDSSLAAKDRKYPSRTALFKNISIKIQDNLKLNIYDNFANVLSGTNNLITPPEESLKLQTIIDVCHTVSTLD